MFHGVQLSSVNTKSCRVCLKIVEESGSLLDENSDLLSDFEFCTDLVILPDDRNRLLCNKCSNKIKSYTKFKKKCLEANEIWKSLKLQDLKCFSEKYTLLTEVKTEATADDDDQCQNSIDINNHLCEDNSVFNIKNEQEESNYQPNTIKNISYKNEKVNRVVNKIRKTYKLKDVKRPSVSLQKKELICCGLCNYSAVSNDENREHLTEHWSNNSFKCNLCSFKSQDSADLLTHRYTHYPNRSMHVCHLCEKKCASSLSLEFHYRSAHLQKPGGFCRQCQKSFNIYKTWKKHHLLHNVERFICDHCGRKFLYRYEIKEHLINHGDIRNFMCEACGKGFKRKFGLKTHIEAVHSSESIKCTHCDKVFKSQITYKDHMKLVKTDKPYKCIHCGKTYHVKSALRSHMFWHSGERPHVCEVCGLKYKSKGQLKVHKRNHTGYMPFKCKECDKCFTSSQPLKRHQSVHTGKRAHKCSQCERTFHEKKLLIEHCTSSHRDIDG